MATPAEQTGSPSSSSAEGSHSDRQTSLEQSSVEDLPLRPRSRPRRSHQKSRSGCVICKRRRIKCDEAKPECKRCQLHGVTCTYKPIEEREFGANKPLKFLFQNQRPTADMFSLSLSSKEEGIDRVLHSAGDMLSVSRENLEAVMRFEVFTSHTLGAPVARHILRTHGISLAYRAPHLMHAIIASSTTHLSHVVPTYRPKVPAEYHWNRAITLFKEELCGPINATNIDAILSTCMMLTIHSFANNDSGSWVFPPPDTGPNWLYVGGGLQAIRAKCADKGEQSIWEPVFKHSGEYYSSAEFQIQDIPLTFRNLCEIDQHSNESNNAYYLPLRTLLILMQLEPSSVNFAKLVLFVGLMGTGYRDLIQQKDPRALLILACWFGLMCGVDQWWVQNRVRSECRAICSYLEHNYEDPRIAELLEFPGLACGYYSSAQVSV
ncbi:transcription factor [Emydomyces testavorans]|uniref:Transcription factor n=1 Tax=Emydomyces testavorans TaxID=2070801 RepID=A0AAF0DDF6_9EURO|nr:transcription factor [Emydomyces testavorans]